MHQPIILSVLILYNKTKQFRVSSTQCASPKSFSVEIFLLETDEKKIKKAFSVHEIVMMFDS